MKILVYAYLRQNFGDDLLAFIMCKRYPEHEFYFMCDASYQSRGDRPANFKICSNADPEGGFQLFVDRAATRMGLCRPSLKRAIRDNNYDFYLILGGSMFIESSWHHALNSYHEHAYAIKQVKGSGVVDSNFGPYRNVFYRRLFEHLFRRLGFVSFRESHSYELFHKLENVSWGSDLVFSLERTKSPKKSFDRHVIVVPVDVESRNNIAQHADAYYELIAQYLNNLSEKTRVSFVSFCDYEGDSAACDAIIKRLDNDILDVSYYPYTSVDEVLWLFETGSSVIASRFHAIFLAAAFGIPVLPLSYSKKIDHCFDDLGVTSQIPSISIVKDLRRIDSSSFIRLSENQLAAAASCEKQFDAFQNALSNAGH